MEIFYLCNVDADNVVFILDRNRKIKYNCYKPVAAE